MEKSTEKKHLTQKRIDALKTNKPQELFWDPLFPHGSFGVRVYRSGRKTFVYNYRNREGRQRRLTIGDANTMTLTEARSQAMAYSLAVQEGTDPRNDRLPKYFQELQLFDQIEGANVLGKGSSSSVVVSVKDQAIFVGTRIPGF